ncbi:hypothetical protein [Cylindrospermopsis curvispora]|uniref:Uncharacterized protein n=1 Tax=Cylindrospermopsis curvispora GIHE-G1 TaxID=2666332 RepID=A0A7H0F1K0_9CYAN|nr:hypothetical protein [Cylindrospermopsis curvispora]QNP29916.1 hypothetical protein IAR63_02100 [Cylindrospermopsis curvispora GIHE-G1]
MLKYFALLSGIIKTIIRIMDPEEIKDVDRVIVNLLDGLTVDEGSP